MRNVLALTLALALLPALPAAVQPLAVAAAQASEPPYGLQTRRVVQGIKIPAQAGSTAPTRLVRAFPNLSFSAPLYLTVTPGSDANLYVVSRRGFIDRVPNRPDVANADKQRFLDLSGRVTDRGGEEGLLGLAFHPDYARNGFFYVYYTAADSPRRSVLSRFSRSASNPAVGDPASERILLTIPQPFSNHNGGCLQFGPDGKLYIASGDGGSANDPNNNAQNLGSLLGKLLRLNDDGSIPSDNPFAATAGARGEIWAYGLRNPWRFSFDRDSGRLWLGDVGQNAVEEVDLISRGGNYGWRLYEGARSNGSLNPDNLPASAFSGPVYTYGHAATSGPVNGQSITGGYVYRGSALPGLTGQYLFADFVAGRVWALTQEQGAVYGVSLVGDVPSPASFGEDNAGNVYVVSFDGFIYRIEPNPDTDAPPLPPLLSQTGLFRNLASLTPAPGMIEYQVNAPFWSDGTHKRRWLALSARSRIGFRPLGGWRWPARAIIVKHFEIDLADGRRKRLETRVLQKVSTGWRGFTYRWNEDDRDAVLLEGAATVELEVADASEPGGVRHQTYEFPSRGACLACHNAAAGTILGLQTPQANRNFLYPGNVLDNQIRAMNHIGLFARDSGNPARLRHLASPADERAPLKARARAYLDSNCGQCHRPKGPTPASLDLRAVVDREGLMAIDQPPSAGDLGVPGAVLIRPGRKEESLVWLRMNTLDGGRMPPIASHAIDRAGVDLVGRWIDAGAP